MKRLTAALGAVLVLTGCVQPAGLRVQGRVVDETVAVTAPQVAWPAVNLDAGFALAATPDAAPPMPAAQAPPSFATLATVDIREGDTVAAGHQVAALDDRLLRATLAAAEADARVAKAQVGVLDARLSDAEDAQAEVADKRAEVVDLLAELKQKRREVKDAISKLTDTRADLKAKRAQAAAGRAALRQRRAEVQATLAGLPPASPARPQLEAALAEIDRNLAEVNAGLKKLDAGLKKLDKGLKQARAGLKKLTEGISKATDGLADLDEAAADLRDARAELTRIRRLARVAADTSTVPGALAETRLAQTVLTAPAAGTVVWAAPAGSQLAPGATVAVIRTAGPSRVTTWLSPDQAAATCVGHAAAVHTDWAAEPATARVTRIAVTAEYPPSDHATDEVHLTRAFAVEVTTDAALPAGVPVTVTIEPCRRVPAGA